MNWIPKPQEIYKHFKGKLYQIVTLAEDSENGETMVVYQALYGEFKVYVRPLEMFTSKVDKVKYPDVEQEYRFALQQEGVSYAAAGECAAMTGCTEKAEVQRISAAGTVAVTQGKTMTAHQGESTGAVAQGEKMAAPQEEEPTLDPLVWEFLDADSHEQRLNILAALHHRITDDMITTLAIACDVEVPEGDVEERYSQLKNCLLMMDRFEIRRN